MSADDSTAPLARGTPSPAVKLVAVAVANRTDGAAAEVTAQMLPDLGQVAIGRGPEVELRLNDLSVSRIHAVLRHSPTLAIKDNGSFNGTLVSGRGVRPGSWAQVTAGETIRLGDVTMVLLPCSWLEGRQAPGPLVIADAAMLQLHGLASRVAGNDINVLLLGEHGTGKELLAEAIRRHSQRRDKPFLRLDGASAGTEFLEAARDGTVFLHEIGDMPGEVQAKLVGLLDRTLAAHRGRASSGARLVASSSRDLAEEARRGLFRQDLYYRLSGFLLKVPPLRERPTEIPLLAEGFLRHAVEAMTPRLTAAALETLQAHAWPGNISELWEVLERALVSCGQRGEITAADLSLVQVGHR